LRAFVALPHDEIGQLSRVICHFFGVIEIHRCAITDYGLDLPNSLIRLGRMPDEIAWQKTLGRGLRCVRLRASGLVPEIAKRLGLMKPNVDRRIAELLCSRICHELVAGIAAVNNGVELISEIDASMFDEAMGLIDGSAKQASARVQYYRMAYGFAGHDALQSMMAIRELAEGLVESEERFEVSLPDTAATGALTSGAGKLILNLIVFAMECLPRGGKITADVHMVEGRPCIIVMGEGQEARLSDRCAAAIAPDAPEDDITALNIHAYFTAALAAEIGDGLVADISGTTATLRVPV
jgi:histidine phosphotransferase ChpT